MIWLVGLDPEGRGPPGSAAVAGALFQVPAVENQVQERSFVSAAYARRNENFVLVSGCGVEVHADSSVLSGVISGPLAHTRGSVLDALGYQGRSPWLVRTVKLSRA